MKCFAGSRLNRSWRRPRVKCSEQCRAYPTVNLYQNAQMPSGPSALGESGASRKPAIRTFVEDYLRTRGSITLPVPPALRFHPTLRDPSGVYSPAIVAAVKHEWDGNAVIAIHATWLQPNGLSKANIELPTTTLGSIRGGVVCLGQAPRNLGGSALLHLVAEGGSGYRKIARHSRGLFSPDRDAS